MIAEIAGTGSWLSDSGPVAAPAGNVLAAHTTIIHMFTAVLFSRCICNVLRRLTCSDVMFHICVCGIMRYFAIFIVYCF